MSGGEALGRYWVLAAIAVGEEHPIPLNPADGSVWTSLAGGLPPVSGASRPINLITPGAAANSFTITGTTTAFIVYGFYFQVPSNVVAGLYAHLYLGNVAPVAGVTVPAKRSPNPVIPGEEYVLEYPQGQHAMPPGAQEAYIMTLSATQDVYGTPVGVSAFQARASGLF